LSRREDAFNSCRTHEAPIMALFLRRSWHISNTCCPVASRRRSRKQTKNSCSSRYSNTGPPISWSQVVRIPKGLRRWTYKNVKYHVPAFRSSQMWHRLVWYMAIYTF
jgi:hypothetical protein